MNRELRYALQGTARHTIFEGETWVSDLLADLTEENARHQISQRFDDRFSYTWFGILFQRGRASWAEKYGLLSLFNKGSHFMHMPIHKKQFRDPIWDNYLPERLKMLKKGHVLAELSWISEDEIELNKCIRKYTDCDNEEYDELEIRMKGFYNRHGHLKAPFTIEKVEIY